MHSAACFVPSCVFVDVAAHRRAEQEYSGLGRESLVERQPRVVATYILYSKNQATTQRINPQASGKQPCISEESAAQKTSRFCFTVSSRN